MPRFTSPINVILPDCIPHSLFFFVDKELYRAPYKDSPFIAPYASIYKGGGSYEALYWGNHADSRTSLDGILDQDIISAVYIWFNNAFDINIVDFLNATFPEEAP